MLRSVWITIGWELVNQHSGDNAETLCKKGWWLGISTSYNPTSKDCKSDLSLTVKIEVCSSGINRETFRVQSHTLLNLLQKSNIYQTLWGTKRVSLQKQTAVWPDFQQNFITMQLCIVIKLTNSHFMICLIWLWLCVISLQIISVIYVTYRISRLCMNIQKKKKTVVLYTCIHDQIRQTFVFIMWRITVPQVKDQIKLETGK